MTTTLMPEVTVADLCDGFVYSELEQKGLFGWGGRLVIQPEYQRNYIYADGKKDVAVVESLLKGFSTDMVFAVPKGTTVPRAYKEKAERLGYVGDYTRLGNSCWYTNLEHGRRHQPLQLMTEADNVKFSKHKEIRGVGYSRYVNYDAIEVPYTDAIPSDYDGVMGVPISFMDKYCPEIVGTVPIGLICRKKETGLSPPICELRLGNVLRPRICYNFGHENYCDHSDGVGFHAVSVKGVS